MWSLRALDELSTREYMHLLKSFRYKNSVCLLLDALFQPLIRYSTDSSWASNERMRLEAAWQHWSKPNKPTQRPPESAQWRANRQLPRTSRMPWPNPSFFTLDHSVANQGLNPKPPSTAGDENNLQFLGFCTAEADSKELGSNQAPGA